MPLRTTLNVSLPRAMKAWIDKEVQRGQFGTASEYLRHLVRMAQASSTREAIDAQLIEGLDSPMSAMTKRDWQDIRREGRRRLARLRRKSA